MILEVFMTKREKVLIKNQSERLLEYMKEHNLSKKKFAEISGLTIYKLDGFLKNKNVLLDTLLDISRATKISIDELVDYKIVEISKDD